MAAIFNAVKIMPKKILIVDDNTLMIEVMTYILIITGMKFLQPTPAPMFLNILKTITRT